MRVLIIGAGEVGIHIATRLSEENQDVVLIDSDQDRVRYARENLDIQTIHGGGSSPKVLAKAGIDKADLLVAVTNSDEVNMIACMIASTQASTPIKIARIRNIEYVQDTNILGQDHLGIDLHINPENEAAEAIYKMIQIPRATEVVDLADGKVRLVGVRVTEQCSVVGQQLKYLPEFHPEKKVLIAAIERDERTVVPDGNSSFAVGDTIWVISTPAGLSHVFAGLGITAAPVKRLMIFGGTNVGRLLAKKLPSDKYTLKMVDGDYNKCMRLAEEFPNAVILHSPFVDEDFFEEENVTAVDAFVSASGEDEENILSALLAKRLGVNKVITVLERPTYTQIVSTIGVDNVVSIRQSAVNKIMAYIRKGKVRSAITLGNQTTEVIEFEALETSKIVGKPLKDVSFPKGSLVVAIVRNGDVLVPGGKDVIEPGDRVLILTTGGKIKEIERLVAVDLSYF